MLRVEVRNTFIENGFKSSLRHFVRKVSFLLFRIQINDVFIPFCSPNLVKLVYLYSRSSGSSPSTVRYVSWSDLVLVSRFEGILSRPRNLSLLTRVFNSSFWRYCSVVAMLSRSRSWAGCSLHSIGWYHVNIKFSQEFKNRPLEFLKNLI